jgi:hypothetical protein
MPGYNQALDNINRSLAGVMGSAGRVATGSGQALEALTNAAAVGMQQKAGLDAQNAANRQRAREMLGSQLDRMANFEMSKWGWDFQQKFQEDAAAKSAMIGSGIQNVSGALSSFGQMAFMNKLYGGGAEGGGGMGDVAGLIGKSAMGGVGASQQPPVQQQSPFNAPSNGFVPWGEKSSNPFVDEFQNSLNTNMNVANFLGKYFEFPR